jgi:bifunctional non-homologous end joining protein LigD
VIAALPLRSCAIDGEAIVCDDNGLAVFDLLRYRRRDQAVTLCAFDLLEVDGRDMRREAIEQRKSALAGLLGREQDGARPARYGEPRRFDRMPSHPSAQACW